MTPSGGLATPSPPFEVQINLSEYDRDLINFPNNVISSSAPSLPSALTTHQLLDVNSSAPTGGRKHRAFLLGTDLNTYKYISMYIRYRSF